jgi:CheY-like chemotaxis protein
MDEISDQASLEQRQLILVIEDNVDVCTYIRDERAPQYRVIEASDGIDGLKKANELIPDLIISDVMMPKMDGFQFCTDIKTDERTSHIPEVYFQMISSGYSILHYSVPPFACFSAIDLFLAF